MKYISTRDRSRRVDSARAILSGLAPDGGLYIPEAFPTFSLSEIEAMRGASYPEVAFKVISKFLTDYTADELREYIGAAYDPALGGRFSHPLVAPVSRVREHVSLLELYHGPTCAFKDFALQLLPYLLTAAARKCGEDKLVAILVATSGDTGKAALEGFSDVPGTGIFVFYPDGGTSDIQRLQMVTQRGSNVGVLAVKGNFDDAQTGVKRIFTDKAFIQALDAQNVVLSSANSINWGRLVPQIAYYFHAYAQMRRNGDIAEGEKINFCVPTGNFGDILAGYYAKHCGLPVDKLICASNQNRVLTDFINTGIYNKNREFFLTSSPSMDILVSSNLERMLFAISENDDALVASFMKSLEREGVYDVGRELLSSLHDKGFLAGSADEKATAAEIKRVFDEDGLLCDPHTAVALRVCRDFIGSGGLSARETVVLSTASPFKFAAAMLPALGLEPGESGFDDIAKLAKASSVLPPTVLTELSALPVRFDGVCPPDRMRDNVGDWALKLAAAR